MKIAELYSHLCGWEYLKVHKPKLMEEIEGAIHSVDANKCLTKISKEKRSHGRTLYSPIAMNKAMTQEFQSRKWSASRTDYWVTSDVKLIRRTLSLSPEEQKYQIERAGKIPIASSNEIDFVKDRVAVEVQFGKYAFVAFDLFVKHMAFYVADVIDVGIEILPTKALQRRMSSGVAYYERELYNVIREGRGVPAIPLVVLGVEPETIS